MESQRLLPQSLEDQVLGWMARAGGIALLALVLVTWISLLSWSNADPSLTHVTANTPRNWLGPLGAILADLLFQTLGFTATLTLVIPLVWSVKLLRVGSIDAARSKIGFFPLAILAVAGALSSLPAPAAWPLNHGLGGVLGDGMFALVSRLFAFINEQRSGFAASLVLFAAAATTVARSLGTEIETLVSSIAHRATTTDISEMKEVFATSMANTMGRTRRRWWSPAEPTVPEGPSSTLGLEPEAHTYQGGRARHDSAKAEHFAERWGIDEETLEPHFETPLHGSQSVPQNGEEAFRRGFSQGFDAAKAMRDVYREPPAAARISPLSPEADYAPQFVPHQFSIDADGDQREPEFDLHTEASSLAIAKRFAPGADAKQQHEKAQAAKTEPEPQRPSAKARAGALFGARALQNTSPPVETGWQRPSLNLLKRPSTTKPNPEFSQTALRGNARLLEDVLADFGIKGEVKDVRPGPVVTLYELEPSRGTKSSRVIGLADDIARSMSVVSVRAAVVPGRNAIGLELPNVRREPVLLREMIEAPAFRNNEFALPLALGKSISGEPVVADLARMPHLLVAGTTGSGKSVGVNAMVLSLLYRHAPEDCRLILIDPKMLELSVYNGIPHLLTPVVTDPQRAVAALNWAVREMEERYKRMAAISVRNIDMFNNRIRNAKKHGEMLSRSVQTGFDRAGRAVFEKQQMDMQPLPHIVIVVDEFADLMAVAGKEVEAAVQRLAQMARAAGIHLIMATQRPSVDVITGTIKANFPTRISFKVTSKIDSRTILNEQGAEQLLGQGDMLFSTGAGQILRVHGAFVSDEEVEAIAAALRRSAPTHYVDGITDMPEPSDIASGERQPSEGDLYDRAVAIVLRDRKASTSYLQRRLSIGYNRAADLIERMERDGLISPANATGKREILAGGGSADAA